jgi:hypothetical protein
MLFEAANAGIALDIITKNKAIAKSGFIMKTPSITNRSHI